MHKMKSLMEVRRERTGVAVTRRVVGASPGGEVESAAGEAGVRERARSPVKGPGLGRALWNLAGAVTTLTARFFGGEPLLERERSVVEGKLGVCRECRYLGWLGICLDERCGCVMGWKARLKAGPADRELGCPRGYWVMRGDGSVDRDGSLARMREEGAAVAEADQKEG